MWKILAIMLFCSNASALTIGAHIGTWHEQDGMNDRNPGLYLEHNGYTIGGYRNSINRDSYYAGYTISTQHRFGEFSLTMGAVTGYEKDPMPMIAPSIKLGNARFTMLLPKIVKKEAVNGIHLSYEVYSGHGTKR